MQSVCGRPVSRLRLISSLVFLAGIASGQLSSNNVAEKAPLAPEPHYADIARTFAQKMPAMHLESFALDDTIAARALTLFLASLDNDHSMFLASDIEKFRAAQQNMDDMLQNGDVSFAYMVVNVFKERARNRYEYVETLLKEGFDLDKKEEFVWKRQRKEEDSVWPKDEGEQNELWRKKVKDQYIRQIISEALAAEKDKQQESRPEEGKNEPARPLDQREGAGGPKTNSMDAALSPAKSLSPEESIIKQYRRFLTVLDDSDAEWILQLYLSAFARAYDPHSDYMSASTAENFDINMKLSLVGIGALLSSEDGAAKVVKIIPGGPADRDGRLQPGDRIIAVAEGDGEPVAVLHWPLNKIVGQIRGKKGTKVVLSVIPASDLGGATTVRIDLVRDQVRLEEQEAREEAREMTAPDGKTRKICVITLSSFYVDMKSGLGGLMDYRSSVRDVKRILNKVKREGVEGVVLDLRGNGGGSLQEAVRMTGLFIRRGPVLRVKDKSGISPPLRDDDPETAYTGPLVVLVSRMSASASEILAAALQDYGRAVIVGDSMTHGKGTVQTLVPLKSGKEEWGSLKVTTATFYRITGASTQMKGVSSDIVIQSPFDIMEMGESSLLYAIPWDKIDPSELEQSPPVGPLGTLLLGRFLRGGTDDDQKVVDLRPRIEALREKSLNRRKNDPRFVARESLLQRLAARQKEGVISLNLAERKELAKEEQRLYDLQQEESVAGEDNEKTAKEKKSAADVVLEESLNILADLIAMESEEAE